MSRLRAGRHDARARAQARGDLLSFPAARAAGPGDAADPSAAGARGPIAADPRAAVGPRVVIRPGAPITPPAGAITSFAAIAARDGDPPDAIEPHVLAGARVMARKVRPRGPAAPGRAGGPAA